MKMNSMFNASPHKHAGSQRKGKYYVMPMFPYPSGDSMHVGHASNYIINDFVARYKKMQGFHVIHPMGFDSFGLPTENYAIKTGKSARQATKDNIVNFKEQIKAINLQFDPEREFATSDPEYYKWTQWIFARLFEHGLAYKKDGLVNRCNGCQTVLANDQVVDGKCERCETIIIQKKHPQRYIKTTALADELIDDLDTIDRPEETKTIQKNWIGRSIGAEIDFEIRVIKENNVINNKQKSSDEIYIICDFDGVLGDTIASVVHAMHTMGSLHGKAYTTPDDAYKHIRHYGTHKPNHTKDTTLTQDELAVHTTELVTLGKHIHQLNISLHQTFIDILKDLLNGFKTSKIAVVSSGSKEYIVPALQRSGLPATHILCCEDHHSKEEKIKSICEDRGVDDQQVYYITDTLADIYELQNFLGDRKLIGVTRGVCSKEELERELPSDCILDTYSDIYTFFNALPKKQQLSHCQSLHYIILHGYQGSPQTNRLPWIKEELEKQGHTVDLVALPHSDAPIVSEQVAYLLKNYHFDEHTVIVGHSLGCTIALKTLEQLQVTIKQCILIAGFLQRSLEIDQSHEDYEEEKQFYDHMNKTFDWKYNIILSKQHCSEFLVLHDTNDPYVQKERSQRLADELGVPLQLFAAKMPHACGRKEPEILQWIGRSSPLLCISVFTTRPDTLYGVTALVLAPENQIIDDLLDNQKRKQLEEFRKDVSKLTAIDRQSTEREKNGMNSGIFVTHPLTGEQVPVWFADYVLMDYATGAVMMVPAHDERDREFAKKYGIAVKWVIDGGNTEAAYTETGVLINSPPIIHESPSPSEGSGAEGTVGRGSGGGHINEIYNSTGSNKEKLINYAKELRKDGTETEKIVWEALRDRKFNNLEFRRQHPIGGYIADFYCDELKLIIEIDGSIHEIQNQIIKDRFRDEDLVLKGLSIIRITNNEILENPNSVYEKINLHCSSPSLKKRGPGSKDNPQKEKSGSKDNPRTDSGYLINSGQFNGLDNITAKTAITEHLETLGLGRKKKTFRLRDRSVSRQRYRGSPIPVYYTFEDPQGEGAINQKVPYRPAKEGIEIKEGMPIVTRQVVKVAIRHRSENKYLLIKNDKLDWHLVAGGVELGETWEQAAIREAKEETIYTNFKVIKHIDSQVHSCFYNPNKEQNRYLVEEMVVLQLIDNEESPSELSGHQFEWIDESELGINLPYVNEQYNWFEYYDPSKKPTPPAYIDRYNAYNPHPDKSKWIPHLIPDEDLPVILPLDLPNYKPAGKSPLEDHPTFKYYEKKEQVSGIFEIKDGRLRVYCKPGKAPHPDVPSKNTQTVCIIIQHPTENKFLLVHHIGSDWKHFCGGGIDEGEDSIQAGIREMTEETGYYDIAEKHIVGENAGIDFYHPTKKINYLNYDSCIYIHLQSLNQKEISEKEKSIISFERISKEKINDSFQGGGDLHKFWRNKFLYQGEKDEEYINNMNANAYETKVYLRECDTLDTFMCSSFYFLRYLDPANTNQLISDQAAKNMPVDLYIGGKEHAVGHLIYSRFIYKFLQKYGYIHTEVKEPFVKLIHQGMVHASDGRKFSKRRGNGINPLDVVKEHNTDTLRTYLAFMGPIELPKNRNADGVAGVGRFLKRFEKLVEFAVGTHGNASDHASDNSNESDNALVSIIHQTIKGVTEDMDNLKFNTAISKLMIATNAIYEKGQVDSTSLQNLIVLLTPFAPDTAQRMWTAIGQNGDVTKQSRPTYNSQLIHNSTIELPIQINGKTKGSLSVNKDITQDEVVGLVRQDEKMSKYLEGGIKKIIRVPGRICNIIV